MFEDEADGDLCTDCQQAARAEAMHKGTAADNQGIALESLQQRHQRVVVLRRAELLQFW